MKPAFLFCALLGIAQDVTAAVTDRQCSTRLGPVSVKNVKRVVKTVIPKPATTTITKVSTHPEEDRSFLDNRYRTTAIEDSTVTTATATSFTTTITITTSTSTIPGPAGFTPAASDVSYRAKKREVPKRLYRAMTSINRHKLTLKVNSKKCEYSPALCPQAVNCREVIKTVITKTVTLKQCKKTPTRTVVLPRRTSTKETTTTTTSTSTIIQADETLTVTARTLETTVTTAMATTTPTTTLTGMARISRNPHDQPANLKPTQKLKPRLHQVLPFTLPALVTISFLPPTETTALIQSTSTMTLQITILS
ncbi:hypothetical protein FGRA07_02313 [Fusarium graminearum]|nr:hypothetical protein FGRA07_02313 [Fusarium graminearum]